MPIVTGVTAVTEEAESIPWLKVFGDVDLSGVKGKAKSVYLSECLVKWIFRGFKNLENPCQNRKNFAPAARFSFVFCESVYLGEKVYLSEFFVALKNGK